MQTEAYMMTVMDSMNASAEDKATDKGRFGRAEGIGAGSLVDGASDLSAMLKRKL